MLELNDCHRESPNNSFKSLVLFFFNLFYLEANYFTILSWFLPGNTQKICHIKWPYQSQNWEGWENLKVRLRGTFVKSIGRNGVFYRKSISQLVEITGLSRFQAQGEFEYLKEQQLPPWASGVLRGWRGQGPNSWEWLALSFTSNEIPKPKFHQGTFYCQSGSTWNAHLDTTVKETNHGFKLFVAKESHIS